MDIECVGYTEYILPCVINIPSEDDVIVQLSDYVSRLFIHLLM